MAGGEEEHVDPNTSKNSRKTNPAGVKCHREQHLDCGKVRGLQLSTFSSFLEQVPFPRTPGLA